MRNDRLPVAEAWLVALILAALACFFYYLLASSIIPSPDRSSARTVLIEKMTFRIHDESLADQIQITAYGPQGGAAGDSVFMEWVIDAMPGKTVPFVALDVVPTEGAVFRPLPNTWGARGWLVFDDEAGPSVRLVVNVRELDLVGVANGDGEEGIMEP